MSVARPTNSCLAACITAYERLEYIDQVIAETHALGDPTVSGRGVGPSAYRRQVERFFTGLPDLEFIVDDTVSEGEKLVYWTVAGTHRGEFLGVPPTNKRVLFYRNYDQSDRQWENPGIHGDLGQTGLMKQFGIALPIQYEMLSVAAD